MRIVRVPLGSRFGHLTPLGRLSTKGRKIIWVCRCDCGTIHEVPAMSLRTGNTRSCGCMMNVRHGHARDSAGKTREYAAWQKIKSSGLTCARWDRFDVFLQDMGAKPH